MGDGGRLNGAAPAPTWGSTDPPPERSTMSNDTLPLTPALLDYLRSVGLRESPLLTELREHTRGMAGAGMQIAPEQGAFMAQLLRLMGAQRVLEVGVYTGYSSLAMVEALPAAGRITCIDRNEEWTAVARRFWDRAGVAEQIELRLGDAAEQLQVLLDEGREGYYDFAFLDADKPGMSTYYECALRLLRPGGLIAADNVLWKGQVLDEDPEDSATAAIRAFNALVHGDPRVDPCLVPIGDGLMLARKR